MADQLPLHGACSCGRNEYLIFTPLTVETLQVLRDEYAHRALSLRIPLSQIQSTTYAFFPDETHSTIRRVFIPQNAPWTKRHFCGFCGTHLTHWSEEIEGEADWVYVSLASLNNESLERLDNAGFFSSKEDIETNVLQVDRKTGQEAGEGIQGTEVKGAPWFEDMIKGSQLGRIRRRSGGHTSSDGKSRIEWEIVEIGDGDDDDDNRIQGTGKRKYEEDTEMKG